MRETLGNPTINIPIPITKSNGSGGQIYATKTSTGTLLGCLRSFQSWQGKDEMAGGGHGESITYKGLTLHKPKRWHTLTGKGLCAVMWFWVFYRAKQDGPVVLGWRHPWEGHDDHGHGHGH